MSLLEHFPKWKFQYKISSHGKSGLDGHHSSLQIISRRYGVENKCSSFEELLECARTEETLQCKKRKNKHFRRIYEVHIIFNSKLQKTRVSIIYTSDYSN